MFCFRCFAQSIGLLLDVVFLLLFSKSSSLFIEDLRDVENLAVTSTCLAWSFDSSPLIFFLIWYLSYEELISIPFLFQRNNVCSNIVVILVLIWRQVAEMVVAETCTELVVVHFVHCPLSTLVKCFWWDMLLMTIASDDLASDDVSSRALLQTRYFRRGSSDAFFRCNLPDGLSFK